MRELFATQLWYKSHNFCWNSFNFSTLLAPLTITVSHRNVCVAWIYATNEKKNSFNKLLLQKEELEQKHVHLLQVVESEKTAKWQYSQQCEELASEIRKLRAEVN